MGAILNILTNNSLRGHRNSGIVDPNQFHAAAEESLFLLLAGAGLISVLAAPTWEGENFYELNPLRVRVGYNNFCVGFDTAPARYYAQIMYVLTTYGEIQWTITDVQRLRITCQNMDKGHMRASIAVRLLYVLSLLVFSLAFVIPPMDGPKHAWAHSWAFFQYIGVRFLMVNQVYAEYNPKRMGKRITTLQKVYYVFQMICTVGFIVITFTDYLVYQARCEEPHYQCYDDTETLVFPPVAVPWYVTIWFDYGWFFALWLSKYLLPQGMTMRVKYTYRPMDREERAATAQGKTRGDQELPMEAQLEVPKGSVKPSMTQRALGYILGCCGTRVEDGQSAAYYRDELCAKGDEYALWVSRATHTKEEGFKCPWAGNGTAYWSYDYVCKALEGRKELLESGKAERKGDLGKQRISKVLSPHLGFNLGFNLKDHSTTRDFLGHGWSTIVPKPGLEQRMREQIIDLEVLEVTGTGQLAVFNIRELWHAMLDEEITEEDGMAFVEHQKKALVLPTLPEKVTKLPLPCFKRVVNAKFDRWMPKIKQALLNTGKVQEKDMDVVATACYELLVFAGGLAVANTLRSLVGLRMNKIVPLDYVVEPAKAHAFALETVRCFPSGATVSDWPKGEGKQRLYSLPLAGNDPKVWGKGFKPERALADGWEEKYINFAEKAGRSWACPGRAFALEMTATFARLFDPREWQVGHDPNQEQTLLPKRWVPYFGDATLVKKVSPKGQHGWTGSGIEVESKSAFEKEPSQGQQSPTSQRNQSPRKWNFDDAAPDLEANAGVTIRVD